jgi:hypothetical protein
MRNRIVLLVVVGVVGVVGFGLTGVAAADPNLTLQAQPHRHFINGVEVGPRYCDNLLDPAIRRAFTQFHANAHTYNGVTGEIGPDAPAPGLHNGVGGEITASTGC